jgi:hypothetical protein
MIDRIHELSARYRVARRDYPVATTEQITTLIMTGLDRRHVLALAEDWRAMGASSSLDDDTAARGFVRNFIDAMDYPDEE